MEQKVSALFAWNKGGEKMAKEIAERYRQGGVDVKVHGEASEDNLRAIGKVHEVSHVLYFMNDEKLLLISLQDEMGGFRAEVMVHELILP